MKDRHAVTEQTLCFRRAGHGDARSCAASQLEGVEILQAVRHKRKLRTGALAGNAFRLGRTRQVSPTARQVEIAPARGFSDAGRAQLFRRAALSAAAAITW